MNNQQYITNQKEQFKNHVPPHWSRINEDAPMIESPNIVTLTLDTPNQGVSLVKGLDALTILGEDYFNKNTVKYGVDTYYTQAIESDLENLYVLQIEDRTVLADKVVIHVSHLNAGTNQFQLIIKSGKKSQAEVHLSLKDNDEAYFINGLIRMVLEEDAVLKYVRIQTLNPKSRFLESGVALLGLRSQLSYQAFDIGSQLVVTDFSTYLKGENSQYEAQSVYLGNQDQKLDIGYCTYHLGRRTESAVNVVGALLDYGKKVFRGNLTFELGSSRSKGSEKETVVLLSPNVKSDTIPALFCEEDDVNGEHAASAGQINDNQLFYLMSRGFDEKAAKQLIIMGYFKPIIDQIKDTESESVITKLIGTKMGYDYENNH